MRSSECAALAIALFGLNIAFSHIRGLGASPTAMFVASMMATLAAGLLFARLLRLGDAFGALAGVACAVCGPSAALATSAGGLAGDDGRLTLERPRC